MKIGVMFGNPETTTGGNALKFYSSVRLDIRRIGAIKKGDEIIGNQTRVKVVKNKVAPPFRQCRVRDPLRRGHFTQRRDHRSRREGQHRRQVGAWYSYQGDRIGQGKDNAKQFLKDNPAIAQDIESRIRAELMVQPVVTGAAVDDEREEELAEA
jgi:recombination protein RecA